MPKLATSVKKAADTWDYGIKVCSGTNNNALAACHFYDHHGDWFFLIEFERKPSDVPSKWNKGIDINFTRVYGQNWFTYNDFKFWSLAELEADDAMHDIIIDRVKKALVYTVPDADADADANDFTYNYQTASESIATQIVNIKKFDTDQMWAIYKGAVTRASK